MPLDGPAFVTPHAVEQFRARIAPALSYEAARRAILEGLTTYLASVRPSEQQQGIVCRVRGGRYAFRAVVAPGSGPAPAVITILRSGR